MSTHLPFLFENPGYVTGFGHYQYSHLLRDTFCFTLTVLLHPSVLQMRKLRLKDVKQLAKGHTGSLDLCRDSNPGPIFYLTPTPTNKLKMGCLTFCRKASVWAVSTRWEPRWA